MTSFDSRFSPSPQEPASTNISSRPLHEQIPPQRSVEKSTTSRIDNSVSRVGKGLFDNTPTGRIKAGFHDKFVQWKKKLGSKEELITPESSPEIRDIAHEKLRFHGGGSYEGEIKNGIPHGKGIYTDPSGNKLEGYFDQGKVEFGKVSLVEGGSYIGQLSNFKYHGQGTFTEGNKTFAGRFENGQFIEGNVTSRGEITLKNGAVYNGELLNDIPHGKGLVITTNGARFKGDFKAGSMTRGSRLAENGSMYIGSFKSNKPHGEGILTLKSGTRFEGVFEKGYMVQGKAIYKNGTTFEGEFTKGKPAIGIWS